ncbi:hypothetical protein AO943_36735 [Pseudomonas aeruginosa]|uniref:Uncharacterized protein n=1 Tax=Pseudomonas putida TaxID=303 RepID=A0A3M8SDT6_PSEPU|nr:hypothetical protein EJP70_26230 [Pseudomonas aeruginosa]RNF77846.1 hypothetical protein EFK07_29375 [Pseudomonas putida]OPD83890.1 hypothetical protein AO943_36735 [Pseudomonas aeruginosa]OPE21894.1 hypothetical protein APA99_35675 [Pseudomonas aeruginosa]OWJ06009.1 hypothetical protein CDC04_34750 [Pseudomonas aeruginosa]
MENPAKDPILIDVGCPSLGYWGPNWMVTDGNFHAQAAQQQGAAEPGRAKEIGGLVPRVGPAY